jgi:hypothetical protein
MNNYALSLPGSYGCEKGIEEVVGGNKNLVYDRSEPFYHFRYTPLTTFFMVPFALIACPSSALLLWFIMLNIALAGFFILSVIVGTDITKFVPGLNKMRLINIAIGTLFLTYALIHSYKQRHENVS